MRLYFLSRFRFVSLGYLLFFSFAALAQKSPTWEWATPVRADQDLVLQQIALDRAGNAYVAGGLNGQGTFGATVLNSRGWNDMVVTKYNAQGQCIWAHQGGPVASNATQFGPRTSVQGLAVDASGQVYVLGTFKERTMFDDIEVGAFSRDETTYLAKYSPEGKVLWVRNYAFGWPGDVVTDDDGSVYISHSSPPNTSGYVDGVLLSKLDAQGNILWSRGAWSAPTVTVGRAYPQIAVGPNHQIYLTCAYQGNVALDASLGQARTPLPNVVSGVFLARYTTSGTLDWVRTGYAPGAGLTGTGLVGIGIKSLAVDGSGNAVIAGSANAGTVVFGGLSLLPHGSSDVYLVKYNDQGQVMWGHQEGSPGSDGGGIVAIDGVGNIYMLANFFQGRANFSGIDIAGTSRYQNNALIKYDQQGNAAWGITQDDGELEMLDIAVSSTGDGYIVGSFYNAFRLGTHAVTFSAPPGAFKRESVVAKLKGYIPPDMSTPPSAGIIPNIITPNEDGVNERFKTPGLQLGQWSCAVFNRWGRQVFYSPHYQQDWNAEGLADGIYFYLLKNSSGQTIKGWIEVLR
jgi:gliding motility-associated-like protein